jgi:hypothetical protein
MVAARMANEIDRILQLLLGSFYEMGRHVALDFRHISKWDSGGVLSP